MSRILVVGMGVPALVRAARHAGPGLRAAHFATALARAGHDVLLLAILDENEVAPSAGVACEEPVRVEFLTERELLAPAMRARVARFAPDAAVGVTVYAASLAARLGLEAPLWADVFGDIMAEAQAKAAVTSSDWSIVHFWTLLRTVLERADRFSAVSAAQSHALVGQLGLAGRLGARTAGEELVQVIPCATEARPQPGDRDRVRRELGIGDDDRVLFASGGVNTWCDVDTLAHGVAAAMRADERVHLVVTGGGIPGHDETSHARLRSLLGELPAARVHLLGWVDSGRLPGLYAAADLALHIERPLYERRLGAENRVIEWLGHGLACVTTAQSEAGSELVAGGLALACRAGDAGDLARVILEALRTRPDATRGAGWTRRERSFAHTAAPLLEWCAAPCFARDRDGARLVRLGLLSQPGTSAEMLEAYVAGLPVREIARRGLRWIARRAWLAATGVTARWTRRWTRRSPRGARARRLGSWPVVLLAAMSMTSTLGGCRAGGRPAATTRPNVLLLSIDTLRPDHLGAYGYAVTPSPSPWIDRLAARGMLFEQAVTSAPETAPALATLLTGVYQDRHGVLYNREKLGEDSRTLAERMKEAGFATAAFVGNWLVDDKHGFAQGFDRFEVAPSGPGTPATTDDKLVALVGDYLREPSGQPWFLWVHMMDPHGPSNSASPWWSRGFDYSRAPLARDGEFPASQSNFGLGVIPRYQVFDGPKLLSDYVRRYDGDIRFTDTQVGAVLATIAATGDADNTIVVLIADHGESLVEHDELLQHGWFLYDTTVRVPLVVSWPARLPAGERVKEQVCSVDVVPGLLDLVGIRADGGEFDGRSFVRHPDGETGSVSGMPADAAALRDGGCFSLGPRANRPLAVRTARHKLILTPAGTPRDPRAPKGSVSEEPDRLEVYDLSRDPGETVDLAEKRPDLVDGLQQPLSLLRSRFRARGWRW